MANLAKLFKQAKEMQSKMEDTQKELSSTQIDVSHAGGAIRVTVNGQGTPTDLQIDPEFLKEDAELVRESILKAFQEAAHKSNEAREGALKEVSAGLNIPGLF